MEKHSRLQIIRLHRIKLDHGYIPEFGLRDHFSQIVINYLEWSSFSSIFVVCYCALSANSDMLSSAAFVLIVLQNRMT